MAKIMGLNGLIHGQYDSEAAFAEKIGWPRQKLNRITNGDQPPSLDDVREIAEGLNVPFMMVANIFLENRSTNV